MIAGTSEKAGNMYKSRQLEALNWDRVHVRLPNEALLLYQYYIKNTTLGDFLQEEVGKDKGPV